METSLTIRNLDSARALIEKANIAELSNKSGIYFLINKKKCLYVGQAKNLKKRVNSQHIKYKELLFKFKKIDIYYQFCGKEQLNNLEKAYIKELKPYYNNRQVYQKIKPTKEDIIWFDKVLSNLFNFNITFTL